MLPRPSRVAALLAASLVTACSGADEAPAAPESEPSFTLSASGDVTRTATGFTLTTYLRDGFSEVLDPAGGGARRSSDVTLIALAPDGPTGHQVNIGILGRAAVGTYRARFGATSPLGARPEFYGLYSVPNADGSRREYGASSGTVTITAVSPMIRGTFEFHASQSVLWPANAGVGTSVRSTPAAADFHGEFVARLPQ
jgi:hypothetical protein